MARRGRGVLRGRYPGWALVTGGSSGIGLAFADALAAAGFDVVLVARNESRLREAAAALQREHPVRTRVVVADLAEPGGVARVCEAVRDLEIGVLISNAGAGWIGRFELQPTEQHRACVTLHCMSAVELTARLLPGMRARSAGAVVLVSSAGAYVPLPYYAVYSATKAFVATWGEALAFELDGSGIDVLVVAPGDTKTNFQQTAGELSTRWLSVDQVVDGALAALGRRTVVVPGWEDRAALLLARLLPRRVVLRMAGTRQRRQTPLERA